MHSYQSNVCVFCLQLPVSLVRVSHWPMMDVRIVNAALIRTTH